MKRSLVLLTAAALTAPAAVLFAASPAGATTVNQHGLKIVVPSSRTVYNSGTTAVTSSVHVTSGTKKVITSSSTIASRNGHRVSGKTVHLAAGSYHLQTTVTYKSYTLVTQKRTVVTHHDGGEPEGSQCVVTASHDAYGEGFPDVIDSATCTNAAFPNPVTVQDPIDNDYSDEYDVGQHFTSDYVDFPAYNTSSTQSYQVRKYGSRQTFTTGSHTLTVHNGGHRKVFTYSESHTTSYVTVPATAQALYSYDCSSFGQSGNWIVSLHQPGSVLYDKTLANVIRYSGHGVYHFPRSGKFRFEVITECDWTIAVYWH